MKVIQHTLSFTCTNVFNFMECFGNSVNLCLWVLSINLSLNSGRHKQEESLFEEMLQVSNAVVSWI